MRKTTPVRDCMSRLPSEATAQDTLDTVVSIMRDERCHHVPIMDGPRLLGVLSREDLHEAVLEHGEKASSLPAGELCSRDVLTVDPTTAIVDVATRMLERRVGSALVTDGDVLVGIFTGTDAVRLIASL